MPPKKRINREKILSAAFEIVRKDGFESLDARKLARELGTSTHPIFDCFASMDEVKAEVTKLAWACYASYIESGSREAIPFKGTGKAYIRFALEEKQLFRELFLVGHKDQTSFLQGDSTLNSVQVLARTALGIDEEKIPVLHLTLWSLVHGIATLAATGVFPFDEALIDLILTDAFLGLKERYHENGSN